ncbi:sel1 repeat family protein [Paraburkholderia caledonica]
MQADRVFLKQDSGSIAKDVEDMPMYADSNWLTQVEYEWSLLARNDAKLNVQRFCRHVTTAYKAGFVPLESVATTANSLLISTLPGAPSSGRQLLEKIGVDRHPALRVVYALSLIAGTGGHVDVAQGHIILRDVLLDAETSDRLKGLATAALADSARLGRGGDIDLSVARQLYRQAFDLGIRGAAYNLGLYWEGRWGDAAPGDIVPDIAQAIQWYRRVASSDKRCDARLKILLTQPPA